MVENIYPIFQPGDIVRVEKPPIYNENSLNLSPIWINKMDRYAGEEFEIYKIEDENEWEDRNPVYVLRDILTKDIISLNNNDFKTRFFFKEKWLTKVLYTTLILTEEDFTI